MNDKDLSIEISNYLAGGGELEGLEHRLSTIRQEALEEAERKLAVAVEALEYVQSLASTPTTKGELVYVDFNIIRDALKGVQG